MFVVAILSLFNHQSTHTNTNNMIKFIQINTNKSPKTFSTVAQFSLNNKINIGLIQEPPLKYVDNKKNQIPKIGNNYKPLFMLNKKKVSKS